MAAIGPSRMIAPSTAYPQLAKAAVAQLKGSMRLVCSPSRPKPGMKLKGSGALVENEATGAAEDR